jgi:hypothetical protein
MALLALVLGGLASIAGGAAGGVLVGRQALGTNLAAMLGAFYGPLAGGAGIVLGLLVLAMAG